MSLHTQIENSKAYKKLDKFKQVILMKRNNRLQIEDAIVTARNITFEVWRESSPLPAHWQDIVKEIVTAEIVKHG